MQLESTPPQPGCGSGRELIPEKFLMHGVDAYPPLSSLPLLTSQGAQGFYRSWAGDGAPLPGNIVPVLSHPGPRPMGLTQDREQV